MKKLFALIALSILIFKVYSQINTIPIDTIEQYFNEVQKICNKDNGKLWGINLWSPIMVTDRNSRCFAANQNDSAKTFKFDGKYYTGQVPESFIASYTAGNYGGVVWTMIAFPLPQNMKENQREREMLFIHEMFHRFQNVYWKDDNGFSVSHMEKMLARILLKLEWNALIKAVNSKGKIQKEAINDALVFNYYRKEIFKNYNADTMENRFEIVEGLAEYTAMKLCLPDKNDIIKRINDKKSFYWTLDSFTRSFGYYSGLLYAFLLDFTHANWRPQINRESDLQLMLQNHLKIILPQNLEKEYVRIKSKYGYDTISSIEENRYIKIQKTIADYLEKLTIMPHLTINLINRHVGFNSSSLIAVDTLGTIFPFIQISDDWGVLKVQTGGCLLDTNWQTAKVNAENIKITDSTVFTNDWNLKLNDGWKIIKDGVNFKLTNGL